MAAVLPMLNLKGAGEFLSGLCFEDAGRHSANGFFLWPLFTAPEENSAPQTSYRVIGFTDNRSRVLT